MMAKAQTRRVEVKERPFRAAKRTEEKALSARRRPARSEAERAKKRDRWQWAAVHSFRFSNSNLAVPRGISLNGMPSPIWAALNAERVAS